PGFISPPASFSASRGPAGKHYVRAPRRPGQYARGRKRSFRISTPAPGVLSTELGWTHVERIERLREKPSAGAERRLRVWLGPISPCLSARQRITVCCPTATSTTRDLQRRRGPVGQ